MDKEMMDRLIAIQLKHDARSVVGARVCAGIVVTELLQAMREPTDRIAGAIHGCFPDVPDKFAYPIAKRRWQAAIDAIVGDS